MDDVITARPHSKQHVCATIPSLRYLIHPNDEPSGIHPQHKFIREQEEMVRATQGTLITCDPAIKSILLKIDADNGNKYIMEDLDETHLFAKEATLPEFKEKLAKVLAMTQAAAEPDSGSE